MQHTVTHLKPGECGIITDVSLEDIPLKLLEMGCLPGNEVKLLHIAPLSDPLFLSINDSHVAIRKKTANYIFIKKVTNGETD